MNTPKKVLGVAAAVAVGLALKGCASSTQTQVYGPQPNPNFGDKLVLCTGFDGGAVNACRSMGGCKSYHSCGANGCSTSTCGTSGCRTFSTTYVAVNNANMCSSMNGCNNKFTFQENNNVKCRLVGVIGP